MRIRKRTLCFWSIIIVSLFFSVIKLLSDDAPAFPSRSKVERRWHENRISQVLRDTGVRPWRCSRMVSSGLGDRFLEAFSVAALARVFNRSVVIPWDPYGDKTFRVYKLSHVLRSFHFPRNLIFVPGEDFDALAGDLEEVTFDDTALPSKDCFYELLNTLALRTLRLPGHIGRAESEVSLDTYLQTYWDMGREWKPIDTFVNLPRQYLVLHLRQGDKKYQQASVTDMQFCTHDMLESVLALGWPVILVTDDDEAAAGILNDYPQITWSRKFYNARATFDKLTNETLDLSLMLGASGILQHSPLGWSSYSASAAMMKRIPLMSTWVEDQADCVKKNGLYASAVYSIVRAFPFLRPCAHLWPYAWTCVNKQVDFERLKGKPHEFSMCRRNTIAEDIARFTASLPPLA